MNRRSVVGLLGKLRGRSLAELRERAEQRVAAELEYRGIAPTVRRFRDAALYATLRIGDVRSAELNADVIHAHFAKRVNPHFFDGIRDGRSAAAFRTARWARQLDEVIADADRIVAGRFDLLGHENLSFGSPIDWHFDPTSDRRAPRTHWSRIPYLDASVIGDHKVIWEINRHQHFFVLARAFQGSGRVEYAECVARHLTAWMDDNPPKLGVNWASSLEVSYRAIAWLWALEFFREADCFAPALLQRMLKYLYVHGRHLERYLSTYFSPNTHLTGEALGLFYLGVLLPEFDRAARWRQVGWDILERELPRQVFADGVYFEQATYYHRYTVDIFLHAILLAQRNGLPVPAAIRERLDLATGHLADLTRGDGTVPGFGDDDGGSLVVLEERPFADVRAALGVASVALDRPEYAVVAGGATEEVLWLLGPRGVDQVDAASTGAPPSHRSRLFARGGYAVMRDSWARNSNHAVIDCGALGAMNCGHAHADTLSIEIAVNGCPALIDTGTFTYTGSASDRDRFRHSSAHNTVTVDGHASSVPSGPFAWDVRTTGRIENWWSGPLTDYFEGSHEGFARLTPPAVHRRTVLYVRNQYWVIADSILSSGSHESTAHFHWTPGSVVEPLPGNRAWIDAPCGGGPSHLLFAVAGDGPAVAWERDWVSPSYGHRVHAPCTRVTSHGVGPRVIITLLFPSRDRVLPVIREIPVRNGHGIVLEHDAVRDTVLFRGAGVVQASGITMDADAAFVRRSSASGRVTGMALFGASASVSADGLTFSATGASEAARLEKEWSVTGSGRLG